MRYALTLLLVGLALHAPAAPFEKGGLLGVGAREQGQGGAVVARIEGGNALWWNAAGLEPTADYDATLAYGNLLSGTRFDTAFSHRGPIIAGELAYGLGYRHVGAPVDVSEDEYAFGLSLPFTQSGAIRAGMVFRHLQARVANINASGYGLDLGLRYRLPGPLKSLSAGLAARDIQAGLDQGSSSRSNPAQLMQTGLAWAFDPYSSVELDGEISVDPDHPQAVSQGFRLGGERWFGAPFWNLDRLLALRLGYSQHSSIAPNALGGQWNIGLGVTYADFNLDYALTQGPETLGPSQRLAVGYKFLPPKRATPTPTFTLTPTPAPTVFGSPTPTATLTPSFSPTPQATPTQGPLSLRARTSSFAPVGQSNRPLAQFGATYRRKDLRRWTLSFFAPNATKPLRILTGQALPEQIAWNGKDQQGQTAPDDLYRAVLSVYDAKRMIAQAEASVELSTTRPRLSLGATPRIFKANGSSVATRLRLNSDLSAGQANRWNLRISAADGRPLRSLGAAGLPPAEWFWDGLDAQGRPVGVGLYYAAATLEASSGAISKPTRISLMRQPEEPTQPFRVPLASLSFAAGEDIIDLGHYKSLKDAAAAVKRYGEDFQIIVTGHGVAGEAKAGGLDELELSYLRAKTVRDFLVESEGLPAERVTAVGGGAQETEGGSNLAPRRADVILYAR